MEFKTFKEITNAIKSDETIPFKIITEGDTYITVENAEGYRAYMEVKTGFSQKFEYCTGFSFYTCQKPNKSTGTGYLERDISANATLSDIVMALNETLGRSKKRIIIGDEKMDTRKPHENGRYLI